MRMTLRYGSDIRPPLVADSVSDVVAAGVSDVVADDVGNDFANDLADGVTGDAGSGVFVTKAPRSARNAAGRKRQYRRATVTYVAQPAPP